MLRLCLCWFHLLLGIWYFVDLLWLCFVVFADFVAVFDLLVTYSCVWTLVCDGVVVDYGYVICLIRLLIVIRGFVFGFFCCFIV